MCRGADQAVNREVANIVDYNSDCDGVYDRFTAGESHLVLALPSLPDPEPPATAARPRSSRGAMSVLNLPDISVASAPPADPQRPLSIARP